MRVLNDIVWYLPMKTQTKIVMLALCDCADNQHVAYPRVKEISWKTGLSDRQVQRELSALARSKLIIRILRKNRSSNFVLLPELLGKTGAYLIELRKKRKLEKETEWALNN